MSVVIPVVDPQRYWPDDLVRTLASAEVEVVVVCARPARPPESLLAGVRCISAPPSRGGQIAVGVQHSTHDCIWVLHADTTAVDAALNYLLHDVVQCSDECGRDGYVWGRFDVHIDGVRWVAALMNLRSRITRICTGDQGMFFRRAALELVGGYPVLPLMEDIEVSKRLARTLPRSFRAPRISISTSGRRWQQQGWLSTIVRMWWFRLRYFAGVPAAQLYQEYYADRSLL
ncbi:MAG: glycosyl transferase [Pseudomonadota bacterium]